MAASHHSGLHVDVPGTSGASSGAHGASASGSAGEDSSGEFVIPPRFPGLPPVPVYPVSCTVVQVGSNPPTWRWHCPKTGSNWLHLRPTQDCQMGKVHLIAAARSYPDGRVRYAKPYAFAALKSQSKVSLGREALLGVGFASWHVAGGDFCAGGPDPGWARR
jgi:hypothetical protein